MIASFQQTLWTVQPVSSGAVRQKSVGKSFQLLGVPGLEGWFPKNIRKNLRGNIMCKIVPTSHAYSVVD